MATEKDNLDASIEFYESMVKSEWWQTASPYKRLVVIYRNQKRFDDEIRVLKSAILALDHNDFKVMCAGFLNRLEKAVILREKSKF